MDAFEEACSELKIRHGSALTLITDYDVNRTFKQVWSTIMDPSWGEYQSRFHLSLMNADVADPVHYATYLFGRPLVVHFDLSWPLDLFMSPGDLDLYNRLFSFLFVVKKTQSRLGSIWMNIKDPRQSKFTREILILRSRMMFFIENLYSYLQVDLIDVEFKQLLSLLRKPETGLDLLNQKHSELLKTLIKGCFLDLENKNAIRDAIQKILSSCDQFCGLLLRSIHDQTDITHSIKTIGSVI